MDVPFWQNMLDKAKSRADAYADAILALSDPTVMRYTLDTGQSSQMVTRNDLDRIEESLNSTLALVARLEARLTGSGTTCVYPLY